MVHCHCTLSLCTVTVHCPLHSVYCTLHTAHCVLHTAHCTLCVTNCTLHTVMHTAFEIITCSCIAFSAPQLVHILVESKPLLATKTFDRLYARVAKYLSDSCELRLPRRIPFQVRGCSPALMSRVRTAALKHVNTLPFPTPVLRWFSTALSILPKKTERIASLVRGYRNAAFNRDVKGLAKKLVPARRAIVADRPMLHLFTCGSQRSRELLKTAMPPAKCTCNAPRRHFPSLFAAGPQHLVCRTPDQWSTLLPEHILPVVLQNAKNLTLPTHDFVEKSTHRLHEQFERFSESDDTFPVFPKLIIQDTILQDNARYISKYPWVNPTVVQECQETLHRLRLSASVWDKHPTDLFAMCSGLHAVHIVSATVLSPSFSLVGVEASNGGANTFIHAEPHRSALEHGILDLARDHKCVGKHFLSTGKWHQHLLACQDVKCVRTKAPSASSY